jgi:hypothetical protein
VRNKYPWIVLSVAVATVAVVVVVFAGDPDNPPGPPESTHSYTLEHIYQRLDTGATGTPITFTEPISGPGTGTMHTLNEIHDLIGERAPVPKTGQTISTTVGDDGDLERGVAWPSPRFITSTTGIVTDTLTGLVWLQKANCGGEQSWADAVTFANSLHDGWTGDGSGGDCELSDGSSAGDWRLPNVRELQSLVDYSQHYPAPPSGHPFTDVQSWYYWSSTTCAGYTDRAWRVGIGDGCVVQITWTDEYFVWPIRGGQ